MNILFIGASKFGLRCLKEIYKIPNIKITGIISNARHFKISYQPSGVENVNHANFQKYASQNNIPFVNLHEDLKIKDSLHFIHECSPDFILAIGWYHQIPKVVRDIAPVAGLHASLLPKYKGGAPLVWSIINGEKETGITFFLFEDKIDAGPIISQKSEMIKEDDTIQTLYDRIEERGIEILHEELPKISRGQMMTKQQSYQDDFIMPQRSPCDGLINWDHSEKSIYNFIRAQTKPYPGAYTFYNQEKVYIWKTSFIQSKEMLSDESKPGFIYFNESTPNQFYVGCGNNTFLCIDSLGYKDTDYSGSEFLSLFDHQNIGQFTNGSNVHGI